MLAKYKSAPHKNTNVSSTVPEVRSPMGLVGPPGKFSQGQNQGEDKSSQVARGSREEFTSVPIWDPKDRSCFLVDVRRVIVSICGLVVKRHSLEGNLFTSLDSVLKSRDITLPTKVQIVQAMVFPVVMYGCEIWTIKKAEWQRIDAFELWCWRRLLRVPWTARRSNQSILKEISPGCSWEGLMLKLNLQ